MYYNATHATLKNSYMVRKPKRKSDEFNFSDEEDNTHRDSSDVFAKYKKRFDAENDDEFYDLSPSLELDDIEEEEEVEAVVAKAVAVIGVESSDSASDSSDAEMDAEINKILESADKKWEGEHPAEVAARLSTSQRKFHGNSDEDILRDLRKAVFSVPMVQQKEVRLLFESIDKKLIPHIHQVIRVSDTEFENLFQVIVKVAAGNTYGKNIYERADGPKPEGGPKATFKDHEIEFLKNSYDTLRAFANFYPDSKKEIKIEVVEKAIDKCIFIRGVYEEVLNHFILSTKYYQQLHWLAIKAKLSDQYEEYSRLVSLIKQIDDELAVRGPVFGLAREAQKINIYYHKVRATIIAPYLRTVYSVARRTARNAHQMLDNFQNGSIGLIRAVSCYSTKRPASFASVAKWWVKQMMLLSIKEDANFVKLPVSTWQAFTQLEKAKSKIGDEDNLDKIATAAKIPVKKAQAVYDTVKVSQVYSLNRTYDSDEKLTLEDIITTDDRLGSETDELAKLLVEYCKIAGMTDRERVILALHYGMVELIEPSSNETPDSCLLESLQQNIATLGFTFRPNGNTVQRILKALKDNAPAVA